MTADASPSEGLEIVTGYLDEHGIDYEVLEHGRTFTAIEEARAAELPPEQTAKVVVLHDLDGYRLAVIPATHRLDMHKVRDALGASGSLKLATEEEMGGDFPQFEVGALPPVGPMLPATELIDHRLLEHSRVLCAAGDHRHSLLVDPRRLAEAANARVADICED
jgi:Ala-tRNA(Pro) deacylase